MILIKIMRITDSKIIHNNTNKIIHSFSNSKIKICNQKQIFNSLIIIRIIQFKQTNFNMYNTKLKK